MGYPRSHLVAPTFGPIEVLVSNDVHPALHAPFESIPVEAQQATLEAIVLTPFKFLQYAVRRMKGRGVGKPVLITSCRDELPMPGGCVPGMARGLLGRID
jgi:NAD(P)-dependent dehydrogenase (short-subunit alcohol dehydrogenase family)